MNYSKWDNIGSDSDEENAISVQSKGKLSKESELPPEMSARLLELSHSDPEALNKLDREIEEMKSRALRLEKGVSGTTPSTKLKEQV